jgi:hypothetical protein
MFRTTHQLEWVEALFLTSRKRQRRLIEIPHFDHDGIWIPRLDRAGDGAVFGGFAQLRKSRPLLPSARAASTCMLVSISKRSGFSASYVGSISRRRHAPMSEIAVRFQ